MKILVACEESQVVTDEMRKLGHQAFSCDILPTSGSHPEWHLQQDVVPLLKESWDMIIAFPPCTHLCVSGARWFKEKIADGRQQEAIDFFKLFTEVDCPRVAIENPVGIMSRLYQKPTQIIQPYEFGNPTRKATCLWLKGLPKLVPTNIVDYERVQLKTGGTMSRFHYDTFRLPPKLRASIRSKTFLGVAKAMAEQWGILDEIT